MSRSVRVKGVILAAGYGSRFLPVTKTIPKEMLPLVDTPSIQFIVDEFLASGIQDILIISSRRKKALEDYFDREMELEGVFRGEQARGKLELIRPPGANVHFIRQPAMGGTASALMQAETFAGTDPFVVAYPDDIILAHPPCSRELIDAWHRSVSEDRPRGCTVLSVLDLSGEDVSRYGVIDPEEREGLHFVRHMVEKPAAGTEPSHLISLGRYLYTADLFPVLTKLKDLPRPGEFYQTEPINALAEKGLVICQPCHGTRYDTGEPLGYLKTIVDYALSRPDLQKEFLAYLQEKVRG